MLTLDFHSSGRHFLQHAIHRDMPSGRHPFDIAAVLAIGCNAGVRVEWPASEQANQCD